MLFGLITLPSVMVALICVAMAFVAAELLDGDDFDGMD